jgi:hypothetical protein
VERSSGTSKAMNLLPDINKIRQLLCMLFGLAETRSVPIDLHRSGIWQYIFRYWYSLVYSNAHLFIGVVVIVFILCSDPVYSMSSFVFCFSKLT